MQGHRPVCMGIFTFATTRFTFTFCPVRRGIAIVAALFQGPPAAHRQPEGRGRRVGRRVEPRDDAGNISQLVPVQGLGELPGAFSPLKPDERVEPPLS